ncbi:MAG: bifunctional UDP-sugar hydrolase/5'-nucleotidase [Lachnospiraceae bacterium]|nr:bifunctional UDP-sugar hydrolase/5'-nucleotidase [Lachnospiraceae bacterium]
MTNWLKKLITLLSISCLVLGLLTGCGNTQTEIGTADSSGGTSQAESSQDVSTSDASTDASVPDDASKETAPSGEKQSDIIILYTNDVHCAIDDNIGYAGLVAYRKSLEDEGYEVITVDAGDHIQGGTYGSLSKGELIVNLMGKAGYDVATLGNHEFDYGMDKLFELTDMASYSYVSCNFIDLETGSTVYDPYVILEKGGKKFAFIGVSTPESFATSTPTYFQDEEGNYIYDFCQDSDGTKLKETVQASVDKAREEGADYVLLLTHLGVSEGSSPYCSTDLISGISGVDAVIDGHSHSIVEMEKVKDKEGKEVLLTQTGTKLANIGKLTVSESGEMKSELISDYEDKDPEMSQYIEDEEAPYDEILSQVIGHTDYELCISDENGNRIVRNTETNLGDFAADAVRYVTNAEIGFQNSGSVRVDIPAGDITVNDFLNVSPFAGQIICVKVTGQEIADALEFVVRKEPEESGGFLQVSGLSFTINMDKTADITVDENGMLLGINDGERRVENIMVGDEPLDLERTYTVGGSDYFITEGGDGQTALKNGEKVDMSYIEENQALEIYLQEGLDGVIPETYANRYGEGRITIINSDSQEADSQES